MTARLPRYRTWLPRRVSPRAGGSGLRAAAPTWTCSTPSAARRPAPRGRSARGARSAQPCLEYALSNRITHGIWGGLTERERRPLQSAWVQDARRDRDRAILAADAAGYTTAAIGRSFGLSRTSVTRIVNQGGRPGLDWSEPQAPPLDDGKREYGRGGP